MASTMSRFNAGMILSPSIEDLPESGLRILELRTDRKADVVMLSEILKT